MSSIKRTYDEKRDFIRMQVISPMTIKHAGNNFTGTCINLSSTGLQFETKDSFQIGASLEVTIHPKNDTLSPFNAKTEVARVETGDETNIVALMITEILP